MSMVGSLAGKRILIVEDEYFIASDLQRALTALDVFVVGPVGNLDAGLALAAQEPIDAAILDVNLEGAQTFPIADRLADRGVPYVFVTGYDAWALPESYRDAPRIAKPIPMQALLTEIGRLFTT